MTKAIRNISVLLGIFALVIMSGCSTDDPARGDTMIPTVNSMVPIDGSTGVALNTTINATFSEDMDADTIVAANFMVMAGADAVAGVVSYDALSRTASFSTTADLAINTIYGVILGSDITDVAGNNLDATTWVFTTGSAADNTPPTVNSVYPLDNATLVAVNDSVQAVFSEGMDLATINTNNFTLKKGTSAVSGTVTYNVLAKMATFTPASNLEYSTVYTATLKTGIKDSAGNALVAETVWTFTTMAEADNAGPSSVRLGTAGNFVILAKTAITTVPPSAITGDIGLSPAAESYLAGFSQTKATGYSTSPQVTGHIYAADMTPPTPSNMTVAILDMQAAYVDAAGRSTARVDNLGAGTVGGLTLAPGLYHWGSNILVTSNLTLTGGANDVWILQSTGNLILSSNVQIILAGGAQAKNVFWQIAGYSQLGTYSKFKGNLLCQTQINVKTGAEVLGRLLAQSQVTLEQNAITIAP